MFNCQLPGRSEAFSPIFSIFLRVMRVAKTRSWLLKPIEHYPVKIVNGSQIVFSHSTSLPEEGVEGFTGHTVLFWLATAALASLGPSSDRLQDSGSKLPSSLRLTLWPVAPAAVARSAPGPGEFMRTPFTGWGYGAASQLVSSRDHRVTDGRPLRVLPRPRVAAPREVAAIAPWPSASPQ